MFSRKEILSIPNILSYFRVLLIPVFMYLYFKAETDREYYIATIVVGVSSITDMFDGLIARRYNMVTELGKLIDPVADKLTQLALIICLLKRYDLMWILLAVHVVKEGLMAIIGLIILKHNGQKLDGAKWYGKVTTAMVYVVMFLLLLLPGISNNIANALIITCIASVVLTLIGYIPVFIGMYRHTEGE